MVADGANAASHGGSGMKSARSSPIASRRALRARSPDGADHRRVVLVPNVPVPKMLLPNAPLLNVLFPNPPFPNELLPKELAAGAVLAAAAACCFARACAARRVAAFRSRVSRVMRAARAIFAAAAFSARLAATAFFFAIHTALSCAALRARRSA